MAEKFGWLNISEKFVALKEKQVGTEEREAKIFKYGYQSIPDKEHMAFPHTVLSLSMGLCKPLDKFLDKAAGEGSDRSLLARLWHFKDDEDESEDETQKHSMMRLMNKLEITIEYLHSLNYSNGGLRVHTK